MTLADKKEESRKQFKSQNSETQVTEPGNQL